MRYISIAVAVTVTVTITPKQRPPSFRTLRPLCPTPPPFLSKSLPLPPLSLLFQLLIVVSCRVVMATGGCKEHSVVVPLDELPPEDPEPSMGESQEEQEKDLEAGRGVEERFCRICHLGSGAGSPDEPQLIELGCACRGELGSSHRPCAEAWFRIRGNRYCEICGVIAKNINGEEDDSFMESWHGRRALVMVSGSRDSADANICWRNQPFCNFLILCLVIAFVLPWFFHSSIL